MLSMRLQKVGARLRQLSTHTYVIKHWAHVKLCLQATQTCIIYFGPHQLCERALLLFPFYRWRGWGTEIKELIQLVSGTVECWSYANVCAVCLTTAPELPLTLSTTLTIGIVLQALSHLKRLETFWIRLVSRGAKYLNAAKELRGCLDLAFFGFISLTFDGRRGPEHSCAWCIIDAQSRTIVWLDKWYSPHRQWHKCLLSAFVSSILLLSLIIIATV